jgi:hypothetical protein
MFRQLLKTPVQIPDLGITGKNGLTIKIKIYAQNTMGGWMLRSQFKMVSIFITTLNRDINRLCIR